MCYLRRCFYLCLSLLLSFAFCVRLDASPAEAERIKRSYELSAETWGLRMKITTDPLEIENLSKQKPDPKSTATQIWQQIAPSLLEDWTISYASFFLNLTRNLTTIDAKNNQTAAFTEERKRVLDTFLAHHTTKPGILPFCVSLAESGNAKYLSILEKIASQHPEEVTKGMAALCASMLLKNLGEEPEIMKKRLSYLRQAIIMASDQNYGNRSVADIATDELYIIRFLSKGRKAPDFTGIDVSSREIKLSDFSGKTVALVFWDAKSPNTDSFIAFTNQITTKYANKPLVVLGITPESHIRIRQLQAEGAIQWNNIIDASEALAKNYRITYRPMMFLINAQGEIEFVGRPNSFVELTLDALLAR